MTIFAGGCELCQETEVFPPYSVTEETWQVCWKRKQAINSQGCCQQQVTSPTTCSCTVQCSTKGGKKSLFWQAWLHSPVEIKASFGEFYLEDGVVGARAKCSNLSSAPCRPVTSFQTTTWQCSPSSLHVCKHLAQINQPEGGPCADSCLIGVESWTCDQTGWSMS